jgi:hypothetical protein
MPPEGAFWGSLDRPKPGARAHFFWFHGNARVTCVCGYTYTKERVKPDEDTKKCGHCLRMIQ